MCMLPSMVWVSSTFDRLGCNVDLQIVVVHLFIGLFKECNVVFLLCVHGFSHDKHAYTP